MYLAKPSTWAFLSFTYQILPTSSFLSILIIKHFDRIREKTPRSYQFFFPLLPPTKHPSKKFPSHFLSRVFHPLYFTSKQTHPISIRVCGTWMERTGIQVFRGEFHTHIHLNYVKVEFLSCIKINK